MSATERPPRPATEWDGFEYVAAPDPNWRLVTGKPCRWMMPGRRSCKQPSVAAINRPGRLRENWWPYCSEHLYGRWIEDGQVMHWILREIGGAS